MGVHVEMSSSSAQQAEQKITRTEWAKIAQSEDFKTLVSAKARFLIPAIIFSVIYYFSLPLSVGYLPGLMKTKIIGPINLAYLFALSQFFVAWFIAYLYARIAGNTFDPLAEKIKNSRGGN
ncbi:MAG: DUF485 domain-containing protein [Clostridia bacterium]|nr:DUF485 domain-containing protein [Clostridia bacterium]